MAMPATMPMMVTTMTVSIRVNPARPVRDDTKVERDIAASSVAGSPGFRDGLGSWIDRRVGEQEGCRPQARCSFPALNELGSNPGFGEVKRFSSLQAVLPVPAVHW